MLQVLALVQREGQDLGGHAGELAALAGQQEVALRSLLAREADEAGNASKAADLRVPLQALTGPAVEVATPAQAVELPSAIASEVVAAVKAALDNVRAGTPAPMLGPGYSWRKSGTASVSRFATTASDSRPSVRPRPPRRAAWG